jgi:putative endonuclease
MYHIYILQSQISNHFYTGQTKDLDQRINLHNIGKIKSSNRYKPWKIIYFETFKTRQEAVKREKFLKSHAGRKWTKSIFTGP